MRKMMSAVLFASILCLGASGQEPSQARDLFQSYSSGGGNGKAGAKVRIELLRGARRSFVPPTTVFRAGDKVKFHFETNFAAYVKIYNRGSSGRLEKLFPYPGVKSRVQAAEDYVVPAAAGEWFEFDNKEGVERLHFSFSSEPPAAPAPSSANRTKPVGKKRPPQRPVKDVVTVRSAEEEEDAEADEDAEEIADEADWTESRDINRVQVGNEQYIFGAKQGAGRAVRITFELQHK